MLCCAVLSLFRGRRSGSSPSLSSSLQILPIGTASNVQIFGNEEETTQAIRIV